MSEIDLGPQGADLVAFLPVLCDQLAQRCSRDQGIAAAECDQAAATAYLIDD